MHQLIEFSIPTSIYFKDFEYFWFQNIPSDTSQIEGASLKSGFSINPIIELSFLSGTTTP